ncbi:MAG: hypothetical protein A2499_00375 [Stygiobacter sp. RIFOXYC12_FULL_38_8]|nr:MAG: hypothetical protein A2299_02430 [Stygiobacter sp. RIFOXYB2_FULL_37_11]OGV13201.1 MAG: hypothetical protein A2440_12790 [Stygiobacter sp. RIFOXYC2_FULL_38_25]OGV14657.1 MAG: hypothetical protein A2237_03490 [Stygiobacter sp. RIFOXYA2_FULL_38_8]OGV26440.1 MAG: hypothetical protein A2499_00375 [Stygiobacter sp. RIFOXYC12_FULL_38_8]OGV83247.1 MAG: hypothetical protein A2X65_16345 [Stygiobacter sp. GWF2_38_21]
MGISTIRNEKFLDNLSKTPILYSTHIILNNQLYISVIKISTWRPNSKISFSRVESPIIGKD